VINRVDQLVNAAKLEGSERIRSAGLRTPRMARLLDASDLSEKRLGIRLPVLVREDLGHGAPARRVRTDGQLARTKLSKYANPIAVEFVKVRNPFDKLVRKYRYVVAGDVGVPLSMHICRSWATKGKRHVVRRDLIEEERDFADRPIAGPFAGVLPIAGPASIARIRSEGHIYNTIRYGRRRMPSYQRIPSEDRWDIVNYVKYINQPGVELW